MSWEEIEEGDANIIVPEHDKSKEGPKKVRDEVFYNPSMKMNRDICISFLNSLSDRKDLNVLDGMAGTGVRGLRVFKETPISNVTVNDVSIDSISSIQKNVEKNSLKGQINITQASVEKHIIENRYKYDYIDIDPFGTPVPYYPLAARYVSHEGFVGITATDTSVLCGTYPKTCIRRYSASPRNNWCRHENGLRILIGYCVKEAARHDRWVEPLLSYYEGHHFRTYLKIGEGAEKADSCIEKLEKVIFQDYWWEQDDLKCEKKPSGPFWTGKLHSEDVLSDMDEVGELDKKILSSWKDEIGKPPFFYETNEISSYLKKAPPPLKTIIRGLRSNGYKASKTHFSPTGIKTDAPREKVEEIFLEI